MLLKLTTPQKIVIPYIVAGILYIFFSDKLVTFLNDETGFVTTAQTYKGITFVIFTGILLYFVSKKFYNEAIASKLTQEKNDNLYKALIENAGDITLLTNGDGTILFTSPNTLKLIGYDAKELQNAYITQVLHPDELEYYYSLKQEILNNPGQLYVCEMRVKHKNGSYIWVESTTVNRLNDPTVKGVITNARDINQRKKAEAENKASEVLFRSAFEQIAVGIAYLSTTGKWMRTNNQLCAITGYSKEEIERLSYVQLYPAEYKAHVLENFNKILNGENANCCLQKKLQKKDGSLIWVEQLLTLIRDEQNNPLYVTIIIKDIDEAKRNEVQLAYRNKELDTFIYRSSHDLRGPITTLMGLSNLGMLEAQDEETKEIFSNSQKVATKMEKILDDLMAVTQIKQHKTNVSSIDANTLVHMAIKNLKNIEKLKQTELATDIDDNIRYNTDEELMKIIVSQLIENAVSFNNPVKHHKVLVSTTASASTINISVTDNGVGISPSDIDSIFDLYYRGKNVDRGSGIGLYLVKSAVEKLGGKIAVNSKEGMGTEVLISIPNLTNVKS